MQPSLHLIAKIPKAGMYLVHLFVRSGSCTTAVPSVALGLSEPVSPCSSVLA